MRLVLASILALGLLSAPRALVDDKPIPGTQTSWALSEELLPEEELSYKPKAASTAYIDSKGYSAETDTLGIAVEIETFKPGMPLTRDVLLAIYATIAREYEEDSETTLVEQKMADFGTQTGVFVRMKTKPEDGDAYDTLGWFVAEGNQTIWVACSFDPEMDGGKDAAETLMKSFKVKGSSAGELKPLPWDN